MWKAVSIDDELLVRNHLRSLIQWEQYGFTLCGEAGDGAEGLRLIDELKPDMAIVDMSMPGMDGVELVRRLSVSYPSLPVVALSSYDSFDYVRGSLGYGAVDYLLKHRLTEDALIEVLNKVRSRLEAEVRHRMDQQKERVKRQAANSALSQTYLKELLIGASADIGPYIEHFQDMPYGREGQQHVLVLMRLLNYELLHARMQEHELTLFIRSVVDLCRQIIGEIGCAVYIESGTFGILLSMEDERSENNVLQSVAARISRMEKSIELYVNSSAVFVQSVIFRSISHSLAAQCVKLLQKMDEPHQGSHSAGKREQALSCLTIRHEKELLSAAEAMDMEAADDVIQEIVGSLFSGGELSSRSISIVVSELMQLAAKIARRGEVEAEWIFKELSSSQKLLMNPEQLEKVLKMTYGKLFKLLKDNKAGYGYSRYVSQAIDCIGANYQTGISLEDTASRLGITPAYLSRLFKEETGSSFTEYLTNCRIERSKLLIRSKAITLKQIAEQVGFNSYSYFIKVFKDHTGETPHSYAEKFGK